MSDTQTEVPSWTRSAWVKWSWLFLLIAIVAHSLNYHWRVLPTTAAGYFARGKGDYLNREFARAVANFTKSIELQPNDADAYFWRGEAYVMVDDIARAMPDLEKAVELRPGYEKAHAAYGDGKAAAWDASGAIDEYSRAIAGDPVYARCYLARGRVYFDSERWDEAAADLRIAARLLPYEKRAPASLLLWIARARGGDLAGATAELHGVLTSGWSGGDRFRASARFLCGEFNEPAYLSAMAAIKNPNEHDVQAEACYLAGTKRLVSGDRPGAMVLLREALKTGAERSYAYDRARAALESLRLGFHPIRIDEALRKELWLPPDTGLVIGSVTAGGPAETAGIRPGAVVATIGGEPLGQQTFAEFLSTAEPESVAVLGLIEDAATRERVPVSIKLDAFAPTR